VSPPEALVDHLTIRGNNVEAVFHDLKEVE
jgi:hypothetical protein